MKEKEFDRSLCFTFYNSFHEQILDVKRDFGIEAAFEVYEAIVNYGLYSTEIPKGKVRTLVGNTTLEQIDTSQSRRSRGFLKEDTGLTKVVALYYRDHPKASQREIANATCASKSKVQKTLENIRKSGLSIDDYIEQLIATATTSNIDNNININTNSNTNSYSNNNSNNNSNSNSNNNTNDRDRDQSRSYDKNKENKEKLEIENKEKDENIELRDLEDLSNEELYSLLEDFQNKIKYKEIQKIYNLVHKSINKNLGKNINEILKERDGILADDNCDDDTSSANASKKKDTSDTYIYSITIPTNMNHSTDYYVRDFSNSITPENAIEKFDELTDPFGFYRFKKAFVKTWFDYEGLPYVDDEVGE